MRGDGTLGRLDYLDEELGELERRHLLRAPRSHVDLPAGAVWLCSNDYLGFADRPSEARGAGGAGASALVWGHGPEHEAAEQALADYAGVEACLLFSSGYAANVGVVSALAGKGDVVVSDALNHASLIDGARLSGARVVVVPHLDLAALSQALQVPARRRFFITESYFSMDGDGPDMGAVAAVCAERGAILVVDEAHAFGILGPEGRGRCAEAGVKPDVLVGTLGKAFGLSGAFAGGSTQLRTWLWNRARSFVFSTALPPALAAAAARRVPVVAAADVDRARLEALGERFREGLTREVGLRPGGFGPIIPLLLDSPEVALSMSRRLLEEGWVVQPMRPPTVPVGSSRLRLTVRSTLRDDDVDDAVRAIGAAYRDLSRTPGVVSDSSAVRPTVARRVAVVGTGTEVGKTHIASALVRYLVTARIAVAGRKPIESGVAGEKGDDQLALEPTGSVLPGEAAPFRFGPPVSPHLAARLADRVIDVDVAARWAVAGRADVFVVESAGGLLSPLGEGASNLDLVDRLQPDVVLLVGVDRLGILHEVSACRLALRDRALWSRCVVALSAPLVSDASTGTNAAELVRLGLAEHVVSWPRSTDAGEHAAMTWRLLETAGRFT